MLQCVPNHRLSLIVPDSQTPSWCGNLVHLGNCVFWQVIAAPWKTAYLCSSHFVYWVIKMKLVGFIFLVTNTLGKTRHQNPTEDGFSSESCWGVQLEVVLMSAVFSSMVDCLIGSYSRFKIMWISPVVSRRHWFLEVIQYLWPLTIFLPHLCIGHWNLRGMGLIKI